VSFKDWKARMACIPAFARTAVPRSFKVSPAIQAALLSRGRTAGAKMRKALRQNQAGDDAYSMRLPLTCPTTS